MSANIWQISVYFELISNIADGTDKAVYRRCFPFIIDSNDLRTTF